MPTVREIFATMEYGPAPESAEFVDAWLEKHGRRFGHFINGRFVEGGSTFEVINPANKATIATVSQGSSAEIDQAVQAAAAAFENWRTLSGHQRARYLYAIARQIQKHSRLFAVLETIDNGKPIRELATSIFRWWPATSIIMRVGRNSRARFLSTSGHSGFAARSFLGIFRS